jgi:RNA polymerase sigma-70 factor (ECF subfamily)
VVDEIQVREFLHTAYPRLVAAVTLVSRSRAGAEDGVHEALVRAWERSERGETIEHLNAWVATVALNLARSGLRWLRAERRARGRLVADEAKLDLDPAGASRVDVDRALARLPRRQREVVVLRYYLQLDTKEVAATLGMHEGTVKSTLARARAALAAALGVRDDVEEANDRGET